MDISIIVVNYNTFELTSNCLESIFKSETTATYEVIVIDNASTDRSPSYFKERFPKIILIENSENLGFGTANNQGMALSKGNYILLLNSDTLIQPDTLSKCYSFITSTEAIAQNIKVMGCKTLNADKTLQPSIFPYLKNSLWIFFKTSNPIIAQCLRKLGKDAHQNFDYEKTQEVGDISGAFMFMEAAIAKETKFFDTDFFMYCEDTEWCRERLSKHGKIYYFPETYIIHFGGQSAPRDIMFIQSKISLGLVWYKKGIGNYVGYVLISCINTLSHIIVYPFIKSKNRKTARLHIKAFFKSLPYLFFDIPKYPRRINARRERLIYTPN
jgi:GT2 family glycosyltransferase